MYPVLLSVGPVGVRTAGVVAILAVWVTGQVAAKEFERRGQAPELAWDFLPRRSSRAESSPGHERLRRTIALPPAVRQARRGRSSMAKGPVCGMTVDKRKAPGTAGTLGNLALDGSVLKRVEGPAQ